MDPGYSMVDDASYAQGSTVDVAVEEDDVEELEVSIGIGDGEGEDDDAVGLGYGVGGRHAFRMSQSGFLKGTIGN